MANAVPVHSTSKKGKSSNEIPVNQSGELVQEPVQPSQESVQQVTPIGVKLESHDAYRQDF